MKAAGRLSGNGRKRSIRDHFSSEQRLDCQPSCAPKACAQVTQSAVPVRAAEQSPARTRRPAERMAGGELCGERAEKIPSGQVCTGAGNRALWAAR
jgi:hypothetical protein